MAPLYLATIDKGHSPYKATRSENIPRITVFDIIYKIQLYEEYSEDIIFGRV